MKSTTYKKVAYRYRGTMQKKVNGGGERHKGKTDFFDFQCLDAGKPPRSGLDRAVYVSLYGHDGRPYRQKAPYSLWDEEQGNGKVRFTK